MLFLATGKKERALLFHYFHHILGCRLGFFLLCFKLLLIHFLLFRLRLPQNEGYKKSMNISRFLPIPGTYLYLHTTCLLYRIAVAVVLSPRTDLKVKVIHTLSPFRVPPWKVCKDELKT